MGKSEICIMCEQTVEQLDGMPFVRFLGTGYLLCFQCHEKLGQPEYFGIKFEPYKPIYQKAKIPAKLRTKVYERDGYRCIYCGSQKDLTVDHKYPESLGGETTEENLATCCRTCNLKKGVRVNGKPST